MRGAIVQVALADISMSLDNVLAVTGAARDHFWTLVFGLAFSLALMGLAANWLAGVMDRYRWIAYVGLIVVLYVAASMNLGTGGGKCTGRWGSRRTSLKPAGVKRVRRRSPPFGLPRRRRPRTA